ncbi:hypothetical protein [Microscilla marina]|uniref:Uncharacterized protein n=1 Tax=Microscilla marina ATCC 23134 TaxID=313606 RepID=A1ZIY3_MICM2|nr:hypothetical protein [Microscilla marina]EAY29519.1 hypothetical protein M23134_00403 [Microscilla marina ATCC 23134]
MKNYHKILLVTLFCLGAYSSQAQTKLFRFVNDRSNLAITTKLNAANPTHLVGSPRSKENSLSQFFIVLPRVDGRVRINSASNPLLYLGLNANGDIVIDSEDNLQSYSWSIDFAGIGTKNGAIGYCVLSDPTDHTKVMMIEPNGQFKMVNVENGLPAGQEPNFRFLLETKADTF